VGVAPNEVTFNTLLNLFVKKENLDGATGVLEDMRKAGVAPNEVTFNTMLNL
jgi:pentatricopeptide repeat protein